MSFGRGKLLLVILVVLAGVVAVRYWTGLMDFSLPGMKPPPTTLPGLAPQAAPGRVSAPATRQSRVAPQHLPPRGRAPAAFTQPAPRDKGLEDAIASARKALQADVMALNKAEKACLDALLSDPQYRAAVSARETASTRMQAASLGQPDDRDQRARDLLKATQELSDLRRAALQKDSKVAEARAKVEADRSAMKNLTGTR